MTAKQQTPEQIAYRQKVLKVAQSIQKSRDLINKADLAREWDIYRDPVAVRERFLLGLDRELAELDNLLFSREENNQ